jgi:hypothetical protein
MELLAEVSPADGLSGPAYTLRKAHEAGLTFGDSSDTLYTLWR